MLKVLNCENSCGNNQLLRFPELSEFLNLQDACFNQGYLTLQNSLGGFR